MSSIFLEPPKKVECRMCKGEFWSEKIFQLHSCVDSSTCFHCLASWRLNNYSTAYAENLGEWWEDKFSCPVCKTSLPPPWEINLKKWNSFNSWMNTYDKGLECTREEEIRRTFTAQQVGEVTRLKSKLEIMEHQMHFDQQQLAKAQLDIHALKEMRMAEQNDFIQLKRKFKETQKELEKAEKERLKVLREKDQLQEEERKLKRKIFQALAGDFEKVAKKAKVEEPDSPLYEFKFPLVGISEIFSDEETQPVI